MSKSFDELKRVANSLKDETGVVSVEKTEVRGVYTITIERGYRFSGRFSECIAYIDGLYHQFLRRMEVINEQA